MKVGWRDDPTGNDPFGVEVRKSWADSFADPEDRHSKPSDPEGPDYWFSADVQEVDFDVHFRLGLTDEGALVVTGLLLGDPGGNQAITTSNLHKLPIGTIYEAIAGLEHVTSALHEMARRFKGTVPTRGGQKTEDSQFVLAADVFRQCIRERPNDTIKCVAERLGVSSATASRRVSRARDLGLLAEPDPVHLDELDLPRPEPSELNKLHPALAQGHHRAKRNYIDAHRRAWIAFDQMQLAIRDAKNSPSASAEEIIESRKRNYETQRDRAKHALDVLLEPVKDVPPF